MLVSDLTKGLLGNITNLDVSKGFNKGLLGNITNLDVSKGFNKGLLGNTQWATRLY